MGCWADLGWAWNIKPGKELVGRARAWAPSAEFTESFVICLYGASNVWLEHLAASQQDWDAMDLEHVSISILFFGGGLVSLFTLLPPSLFRDSVSVPTLLSLIPRIRNVHVFRSASEIRRPCHGSQRISAN